MADEGLFFTFSTNGPEVVGQVAAALGDMNTLLSRAESTSYRIGNIDTGPLRAALASASQIIRQFDDLIAARPNKRGGVNISDRVQAAQETARQLAAGHETFARSLPPSYRNVDFTETLKKGLQDHLNELFGPSPLGRGKFKDADIFGPLNQLSESITARKGALAESLKSATGKDESGNVTKEIDQNKVAIARAQIEYADRLHELSQHVKEAGDRYRQVGKYLYDTESESSDQKRFLAPRSTSVPLGGERLSVAGYDEVSSTRERREAEAALTGALARDQKAIDAEAKAAQAAAAARAKQAAAATTAAAAGAGHNGPTTPIAGFLTGFLGNRGESANDPAQGLTNFASSVGITAKYTLAYQALQLLRGELSSTVQAASDMADSQRDLDIALGDSGPASAELINNLTQIAAFSGSNVGAAMDATAAGVRAFGASAAGDGQFAQAVSNMALLTNTSFPDAQGNMLAVSNAWDEAGSSFSQANDVITSVSKNVGGNTKQISQGLASIADAAAQAGASMSEAGAAIGLVQARTDETGQAIATRLSRVFSILGGTTGRGIIDTINTAIPSAKIDPTETVWEQFHQIANAFKQATPQLQGLIVNALGGSSNTKELLPILNNPEKVFGFKSTPGLGVKQANLEAQNLAGTLRNLTGDITAIKTELVNSDIFAPFGLGLVVFEKMTKEITKLLGLFNRLKAAVPGGSLAVGTAASLATVVGAYRLFNNLGGTASLVGIKDAFTGKIRSYGDAGTGATSPISSASAGAAESIAQGGQAIRAAMLEAAGGISEAGAVGGAEIAAAEAGAAVKISGAASIGAVGTELEQGAASSVLGGGGFKAAGLLKFAGPAAAIGTVIAAVNIFQDIASYNGQIATAQGNLLKALKSGSYQEAIDAIQSNRGTVNESQGGLSALLVGGSRDSFNAETDNLVAQIQDLKARAEIESKQRGDAGLNSIDVTNKDAITGEAQRLHEAGFSAVDTFGKITDAINRFVADAPLNLSTRGAEIGTNLTKAFGGPDDLAKSTGLGGEGYEKSLEIAAQLHYSQHRWIPKNPFQTMTEQEAIKGALEPKQDDILKFFTNTGSEVAAQGTINKQQADEIAAAKSQAFVDQFGDGLDDEAKAAIKKSVQDMLTNQLESLATGVHRTIQTAASAAEIDQALQGALGAPGVDSSETAGIYRQGVAAIDQAIAQGKVQGDQIGAYLDQKERWINSATQAEAADAIKLLRHQQNAAGSSEEAQQLGERTFGQLIRSAADTGDTDAVISLIEQSGDAAVAIARAALTDDLRIAEAALKQKATNDPRLQAIAANLGVTPLQFLEASRTDYKTGDDPAYDAYLRAHNAIETLGKGTARNSSTKDNTLSGTKWDSSSGDTQQAIDAARRQADAAKSGGSIAPAQATLANAKEALDNAKPNTVAYFQALAELFNSQRSLAQAIADYATTMAQLGSDLTDPVAQARLEVQKAQKQLTADKRSGSGKDVLAKDQLDLRKSQQSREDAAFQQRIKDVQTSEQLGRLSHAAVIRFYQSEHDRLTQIKHRTRQEQDELDQTDLAIKAAVDQTNGAFNLTDIKLPTPYEVRRYISTVTAGVGYQASGTNVTNVTINGADTAEVRSVLSRLLGPTAMQTTGAGTRKV